MSDNKTEQPTKKRLDKAREEGQFLSAREMVGGIQFIGILMVLGSWLPRWWTQMRSATQSLVLRAFTREIGEAEWPGLIRSLLSDTLMPLVIAGTLIAVLTLAVQLGLTKMGFSLKKMAPDLKRLNPLSKLKELPKQNIPSVVQAIVLLLLVGAVMHSVTADNLSAFFRLPLQNLEVGWAQVSGSISSVLWKAGGLFLVFGAVDLFRQQKKLTKSLKMTKEEVKREMRESDGDPHIKGRIRRIRRDLLRRNMMKEIPTATAVIVNPTHYAVVIKYDMETMASPLLVAKGKDYLALRMRQIAVEHGVPIVENPPLARAMYSAVKVGQTIPTEFYRAVAEILAYIYKVMGQKVPVRQ